MSAAASLPHAEKVDAARAAAVAAGAIAQVILAFLPDLLGLDATIATRAEGRTNPLIPYGAAFIIWVPLFAGSLWFAFLHARAENLAASAYRRVGWWVAAAFWANSAYAVMYPIYGSPYGDSLTILPLLIATVFALRARPRDRSLLLGDRLAFSTIAALAGWISVAATVTFATALDAVGAIDLAQPASFGVFAVLALGITASAGLAAWSRSLAYAGAASWGLFWLTVNAVIEQGSTAIAVLAGVGAALLPGLVALRRRFDGRPAIPSL